MTASIPVVNFLNLSSDEERKKLREACEKCGCFRLINHPIPLTLMAEMKLATKHLHELPKEIKMRNKDIIPDSGYVSSRSTKPLYEAFGIYDMHASPKAAQDFFSQLNVSPHHSQIIEAYGKAIHDLSSSVSQKMAESLGIENTDFMDWPFVLRIINYNFSDEPLSSKGLRLHTDSGFMTLLHDDETVCGLELMDDSNSFKEVTPMAGSFLCIIGDVGHAWSNGRFYNVRHRVISKEKATRYSFGAFMLAPRNGIVGAPKELVDSDEKLIYPQYNYEDSKTFRLNTGKRTGEFLEHIRSG